MIRVVKPDVKTVIDFPIIAGESPTWDEQRGDLWFVDMLAPAALCLRNNGTIDRYEMPATIGCLALCENGEIAVALESGVHILDPVTGCLRLLCNPDGGRGFSRLNDGKVGPDGCFWVGTRDEAVPQTGNARLYRVRPDGSYDTVIDGGLLTSNGLAWSPDGQQMYHSDSSGLYAQVFDFDVNIGIKGNARRLHDFTAEEGRPDGATVDTDGYYWIAGQQGSRLNRLTPSGEVVEAYLLPAKGPSMCCFGGPELSTIYVTTLSTVRNGVAETGTLLAFDVGIKGVPTCRFAL
ncbi:SMP-30/gluconolactonase/LRE family protein [Agrobacterium pusense]|uniref:Gluconolactonase n=1 Tax=Agrobacterium pusense TaxID=648995 RepID=U4Q801_9HYPH|nr:SMP-30/gluconolactonase/LRE family protein [Agrobacterium pusense]CDI12192.1 Gluconolactonase [Agrobacterium pusense]